MRTTTNEDRDFISSVISSSLLEEAIEYIKNKFRVDEVYDEDVLEEWALDHGFIKED